MTTHYIDQKTEKAVAEVIAFWKEKFGIEITHSQAVLAMYATWKEGKA